VAPPPGSKGLIAISLVYFFIHAVMITPRGREIILFHFFT
jgi:hypothetical protein